MATSVDFVLPEQPSRTQQRFELHYRRVLRALRKVPLRWEFGPVEVGESGLARYVGGWEPQWHWLRVRHASGELIGQLALVTQGFVGEVDGQPFSAVELLQWLQRQLQLASKRARQRDAQLHAENAQTIRRLEYLVARQRQAARRRLGLAAGSVMLTAGLLLTRAAGPEAPALAAALSSWWVGAWGWSRWLLHRGEHTLQQALAIDAANQVTLGAAAGPGAGANTQPQLYSSSHR